MEELRYLKTKLIENINTAGAYICEGGCQSYDQYMEAIGRLRGLSAAVDAIDEMLKTKVDVEEKSNASLTPIRTGV